MTRNRTILVRAIALLLITVAATLSAKQPTVITKTVIKPLQKAAGIGIEEAETTDPKTGEVKSRIMLTPTAQRFLLDNLDKILEEK